MRQTSLLTKQNLATHIRVLYTEQAILRLKLDKIDEQIKLAKIQEKKLDDY